MAIIHELNSNNYSSFKKNFDGKFAVLKFWAPWCTPCAHYAPTFKDFAEKLDNDDIVFAEIDIDKDDAGYLTNLFGIKSIPVTLIVDSNMKTINRISGAINSENLKIFVNNAIKLE